MFDPYATHLEALVNAALETPGDILELGCGNYSTPILSAIARHRGNRLSVKSSCREWAEQFTKVADVELDDSEKWTPEGKDGLVFLDNEQLTRDRIKWLPELQQHCDCIVMHDSDAAMSHSHYPEMVKGFKRIKTHNTHTPWTVTLQC